MTKLTDFLKYYRLPILSGVLIGFSYIPFPPLASWCAFAILWTFWFKAKTWKQVFLSGWLTQFILTIIGFNWITHTIHEFGEMPWAVSIAGFLAFCAFANLDVAIAGALWWFLAKKVFKLTDRPEHQVAHLIIMAICTLMAKDYFPAIFLWNYGYPFLFIKWPMAQTGELIGFEGISDIVILANILVFLAYHHRGTARSRRAMIGFVAAFAALNLAGYALLKTLPAPNKKMSVLIAQANIGNIEKVYAEKGLGFRESIFSRYKDLTVNALEKAKAAGQIVDAVMWPETAYPYEVDQRSWQFQPVYPSYAKPLRELAMQTQTLFLVGGYGFAPADGKMTNTFFVFESDGNIQKDPYFKTTLLAFGEYIPFGDVFPILYKWIPAGQFGRGPGPKSTNIHLAKHGDAPPETLRIGPQICYEGLFYRFSRGLADQGADIFMNVTNDSWYGERGQQSQHLFNTLGRAIEYRRPLVRSTNTGISTAMLADGTLLEQSPLFKEWSGVFEIPYREHAAATFYQKCPWLLHALLILMLAFLYIRVRWQKPTNSKSSN